MNSFNFPKALTALPNWVCWRLEPDKTGRPCKVPYNPITGKKALPNKPETWATFNIAVDAAEKYGYSGVGFIFTLESGIVGVDIDKCFDNDCQPNNVVKSILEHIPPTYVEYSPSGHGLHIFLKGTLPTGGNRNSTHGVEMYAKSRYFTMTGNQYTNCVDKIADDNGALKWIHSAYIKPSKKQSKTNRNSVPRGTSCLSDDELINMASDKDKSFAPLWNGQWEGKYKSHSEADMALCGKLAWWTNADTA